MYFLSIFCYRFLMFVVVFGLPVKNIKYMSFGRYFHLLLFNFWLYFESKGKIGKTDFFNSRLIYGLLEFFRNSNSFQF